MEFTPNFRISPKITTALLSIERHKEAIRILPFTTHLIASLRETARLMSTHYSTQIEGNQLTPEEVKQIAIGAKGGFPGRERDEREVRNYFRALEFVEQHLRADKPISEVFVQQVHSLVLTGTNRKTPYREGQNVITDSQSGAIVYMPPEAKDVTKLMSELIQYIQREIERNELPAPLLAGIVHYQFATIHPYYDGNGRTARLLTTCVLHRTGYGIKGIYSLEEYYAKNLQDYYQALDIGDSHNYYMGRAEADITGFLEYFTSGMSRSFEQVRTKAELLQELSIEPREDQSDILRELSPQQRQVLSLFEKYKEVSSSNVAEHLGISSRSARYLIQKWIEQDFIKIIQEAKRNRTYGLVDQWDRLVQIQQARGKNINGERDIER